MIRWILKIKGAGFIEIDGDFMINETKIKTFKLHGLNSRGDVCRATGSSQS